MLSRTTKTTQRTPIQIRHEEVKKQEESKIYYEPDERDDVDDDDPDDDLNFWFLKRWFFHILNKNKIKMILKFC